MSSKHSRSIDRLIFTAFLLGYTALFFVLFYRQAARPGDYVSDTAVYLLEMTGQGNGYVSYPILFWLGALLHLAIPSAELAFACALSLLNSLTVVVLKNVLDMRVLPVEPTAAQRLANTLCCFALLFVSMLYCPKLTAPLGIWSSPFAVYNGSLGVGSPNPLHNSTYLAARGFAVVTFFLFADLLTTYEDTDWPTLRRHPRNYLLFAFFLFLTTMTKPSFTLVLVSVAGLLMLYRLFRRRFANFWATVRLGLCFVPTFLALVIQYAITFVIAGQENGGGGIGFAPGAVWEYYCGNLQLGFVLANFFPLVVLVCNLGALKTDSTYRFSWQFWAVSFAEWFFLYEKGERIWHANFNWGYLYGLLFLFICSAMRLLRRSYGPGKAPLWQLVLQWAAFGLHLVSGILYFIAVF